MGQDLRPRHAGHFGPRPPISLSEGRTRELSRVQIWRWGSSDLVVASPESPSRATKLYDECERDALGDKLLGSVTLE